VQFGATRRNVTVVPSWRRYACKPSAPVET